MIRDAFKLHDTYGLPLPITLMLARQQGASVDVPQFYRDALAAGWSSDKALSCIDEALSDAGQSREYIEAAKEWLTR